MEWTVLVEAVAPEGASPLDIDDPAIDRFLEALDGWGGAVSAGANGWSARIAVEARNVTDAITDATCVVGENAKKAGLPKWPVLRVEALEWAQFEAELAKPNFPDIIGTTEVAELLGVSRQRLHELRTQGRFPEPMTVLAASPIWMRPTVEAFLEAWPRKGGRPARSDVQKILAANDELGEELGNLGGGPFGGVRLDSAGTTQVDNKVVSKLTARSGRDGSSTWRSKRSDGAPVRAKKRT